MLELLRDIEMTLTKDQNRFLEEWMDFLKIPSVSANPSHNKDVQQAAKWVEDALKKSGCPKTEIISTPGHPIVYGEYIKDVELPTVLVYGHYDVQPPDPLELWDSSPFEPIVKKTSLHPDGAVFARGACDDKGQMFMHIKAFEIMLAKGPIPCNIKFMIEGEEEVGSDNLEDFVKRRFANGKIFDLIDLYFSFIGSGSAKIIKKEQNIGWWLKEKL